MLLYKASIYFNMAGLINDSLKFSKRNIQEASNNWLYLIEYGIALNIKGKQRESEKIFKRAFEIQRKESEQHNKNRTYEDVCDMEIKSAFQNDKYGWVIVWGYHHNHFYEINVEIQKIMAEAYIRLGLYEKAFSAIHKTCFNKNVSNSEIQEWYAHIEYAANNYERAIFYSRSAYLNLRHLVIGGSIEQDNQWKKYISNHSVECQDTEEFIARCWYGMKEWSKAETSVNFVLAITPQKVELYRLRANIRFEQGRWVDSIEDCNRIIKLIPYDGDIFVLRAKAHLLMDDFVSAEKDLQKASLTGKKETVDELLKQIEIFRERNIQNSSELNENIKSKPRYKGSLKLLARKVVDTFLANGETSNFAEDCREEWEKYDWDRRKENLKSFASTARTCLVEVRGMRQHKK